MRLRRGTADLAQRNSEKPDLVCGADKSATKTNGLSLHPYWEAKPSCGVLWVLAE